MTKERCGIFSLFLTIMKTKAPFPIHLFRKRSFLFVNFARKITKMYYPISPFSHISWFSSSGQWFNIIVYSYLSLLIIGSFTSCGKNNAEKSSTKALDNPLFKRLPSEQTGLDFINEVEDTKEFNVLTYRNYYNGGGVAIGDINNDKLPDIYFTANMGKNKLYLNKGNWEFEDITDQAGVGGTKGWSTGVSMADVNGDGWLDIYVCNSGDLQGDNKENELFINNGAGKTFTESAIAYNLADEGFSTHASFFDYDLDGDLDCYVLNNSFKDPEKIDINISSRQDKDHLGGDKLFRNDGEKFTDVTHEAGIYNSMIGFGLGVSVSDLNGDMLPDIYISNDFWERDYLYLNRGDGTFSEELTTRISKCSVSSMGSDIADINNDGTYEVFTTDMLAADNYRLKAMTVFDAYHLEDLKYRNSFHFQIMQNSLQLNDGNAHFQEIANLSGVAATDWSWGALIFDFDNDGWKDIFVSNGIYRDIMYLDFTNFINDSEEVRQVVEEKGEFDWRDFVKYMPSTPLANYAFVNKRNLTFENQAKALGLGEAVFSNGSAYGDLDGDGDMDLVLNNVNMPAFIYQNTSTDKAENNFLKITFKGNDKNSLGVGAEVTIEYGDHKQVMQHYLTRGFESSVAPGLLFGLGETTHIDKLTVTWPNKRMQVIENIPVNQEIELQQINAHIPYDHQQEETDVLFTEVTKEVFLGEIEHKENIYNDFDHELLLPRMLSTEGPKIVKGDLNGDNLEDILLLGAAKDPDKLFLQQANGKFRPATQAVFEEDKSLESTCGVMFDADGDGDLDVLVGAGGNEYQKGIENFLLRYYKNDGKGNLEKAIEKTPPAAGNFSCIAVGDIENDGDPDIFIGGRAIPGHYGRPPRSFLLRNDGGEQWTDIIPRNLGNFGMVTDAVWADIENDGDQDLIVVGEWMPIMIFESDGKQIVNRKIVPNSFGWWTKIEASDLDNDGNIDFILGNWGLNSKMKASNQKPLSMFVKDFDNNSKSEFIINWYAPEDERPYPVATKMDISTQLPHLKKSILKYEDYAHKTYETLFSEDERKDAISYVVNYLKSAVLWNNKGKLSLQALPIEAQIAPAFAIIAEDLDNDGLKDLWLGGNFYGLKPQFGRHDASKGVFLKGDGQRGFKYLAPNEIGISVQGEVRDATILRVNGLTHMLIARNDENALIFRRED